MGQRIEVRRAVSVTHPQPFLTCGFEAGIVALAFRPQGIDTTDVQEEPDEADPLDDIDPDAIREELARNGIVNGEVVDPEALARNPFIQQVKADVAAIPLPDGRLRRALPALAGFLRSPTLWELWQRLRDARVPMRGCRRHAKRGA